MARRSYEPEEQWVDAEGVWPRKQPRLAPRALPGPQSERRQFQRMALQRRAQMMQLGAFDAPGELFDCSLVDVSRGGLGLVVARMIHEGRRVVVEVAGNPGQAAQWFCGIVRQVRYVQGVGHIVGIKFEPFPKTAPFEKWLIQRKRGQEGGAPPTGARA